MRASFRFLAIVLSAGPLLVASVTCAGGTCLLARLAAGAAGNHGSTVLCACCESAPSHAADRFPGAPAKAPTQCKTFAAGLIAEQANGAGAFGGAPAFVLAPTAPTMHVVLLPAVASRLCSTSTALAVSPPTLLELSCLLTT